MREYMQVVLYALMELLSYSLGYVVFFNARFTKRPTPYLLVGMMFLLINGVAVLCGSPHYFWSATAFLCIVIPLFLIEKREMKWFLLFLPIIIEISVLASAMTFVWGLWTGQSETEILEDKTEALFCEGMALVVLIVIFVMQKMFQRERREVYMDKSQYLLFYIGTICSFILTGSAQGLVGYEIFNEQIRMMLGLCIVLVCITFMVIIFWQGIVRGSEIKYRERAQQYETYMKMQEQQIQNVIASDEAMRRYRHDMHAHFTAIQALSEQSRNEELTRYLADMNNSTFLEEIKNYTGNTAVDAVINQVLMGADTKGITVHINATLSEDYEVSDYELCTLISNLLQNAVEACEKVSGKKWIEVKIYPYENKLYLLLKNTTEDIVRIIDNRLQTTKEDRKNHGLGSMNVKNIVEQHGGFLRYTCQNGWFEVEIIL